MNNEKIEKNYRPIIFTPGLNQLYFVNFDYLNYLSLSEKIINVVKNKNSLIRFEETLKELNEDFQNNKINNYLEYKNCLLSKMNINFDLLLQYFDDLTSTVSYLHKNQFSFLESIIGNIYNKNPFYLLIDEIFLTKYKKEYNVSFNYYTLKELNSTDLIKNLITNNKIFLYSYEPSILVMFKRKFVKNIFTFLLNIHLFCFKDLNQDSEEYKIVNEVKHYFETEKQNNNIFNKSPYIINFEVNFLSTNIFSYNFLYYKINSKNIESYELLINYFEEIKPKVILIFTRFLTRKQNFLKQRYFISDESIIYKPHYGGINKYLNGRVDIVLAKSYELKDFVEYKNIFNFLENNYSMANDIHEFIYFIDKNLQNKFLSNFCRLINKSSLFNKYQGKYALSTINSITLDIKQFKYKNDIIDILEKNNIEFPIILKYTSDNTNYKHQISIILNENYLDNFINNYIIKTIVEKYSTSVLIQHTINHGGYVLKIYHMGNKNYIDYRSSLIDIDKNNSNLLKDVFKNEGFWNFKTIMLESDEYKKNIWNKFTKKGEIEKMVKSNKDLLEYIISMVNMFEIYSHMGLFGIDIIIENDKFFIIDANSLPGYKLGFTVEQDLRNYFNGIIS